MHAYAQFERVCWAMSNGEALNLVEQMQWHGRDLASVVDAVVSDRQTANDHVRIADRFHLVDVIVLDDGVKQRVEVVQQLHHLGQSDIKRINLTLIGDVFQGSWIVNTRTLKSSTL